MLREDLFLHWPLPEHVLETISLDMWLTHPRHNWPRWKRTFHSIVPTAFGFLWYVHSHHPPTSYYFVDSISFHSSHVASIPTPSDPHSTFGSSVYTPGSTSIEHLFHVSRETALLPFIFYLLGLSFGPVLAAPLSENHGRRFVYLSAVPISGLFTLGAGFSNGIVALTICRFFAGLFSSPGLSIGTGTIADVWEPHLRALPMTAFITSVQMGPALG